MNHSLSPILLNQIGLVIGFIGAILLAFSNKVGVVSRDGCIIFNGLDPMNPAAENIERVQRSHWRNRFFTPAGWSMLSASFLLQFLATLS